MTCSCREALEKIILPPDGQTRSLDSNYYRIQIIAREALAKPCECEKPERCYDANCSMPNGHPGMHYDKRDGVAWGAE
jgi:hypothetical protein